MDKVVVLLLRFAGWLSGHSSATVRTKFGALLGWILRKASRKRQAVTLDNIRHAFPEQDAKWHKRIMRLSYRNLGITLAEFVALPYLHDEEIASWFTYKNVQVVEKYLSQGKSIIFLSGHFGNWEFGAYSIGLRFNKELIIVVKPQRNSEADILLNSYRTRATNSVVAMNSAARTLISAMDSGKIIAMLADQAADPIRDVFVDFFGRKAVTYKAPAYLALRSHVPIITGYVVRLPNGKYEVELQEIACDDVENTPEGIATIVQRYTRSLEDAIRQHPELWSWQHKRWKYNPNDYKKEINEYQS